MIIKISFTRLFIIFSLVIILPLVQNQWLNLSLFEINNFSFYKFLYYLSGLICPLLICKNSINNFTYYKFNSNNRKSTIRGKSLLIISSIFLITLSILISNYFYFNFELLFKLIVNNKYIFIIDFYKNSFFILFISIFLISRITRIFLKKFLLLNFFMISLFIWFIQINNIVIDKTYPFANYLNIDNLNFINVLFLLIIELFYYLWSYISYDSNLSDWIVPKLKMVDFTNLLNIIIFYLCVMVYYLILNG